MFDFRWEIRADEEGAMMRRRMKCAIVVAAMAAMPWAAEAQDDRALCESTMTAVLLVAARLTRCNAPGET